MSDEEQAWEDESSEAKRARKGKAAMTDEEEEEREREGGRKVEKLRKLSFFLLHL
jgi:hypothetical protein